jgi:hypothetical protein
MSATVRNNITFSDRHGLIKHSYSVARFQVVTQVLMENKSFCNVAPFRLINSNISEVRSASIFRGKQSKKTEYNGSSTLIKTSVAIYISTVRKSSEDLNLRNSKYFNNL